MGSDFQPSIKFDLGWETLTQDPNCVLLDVRNADELAVKRLENSVHVPVPIGIDAVLAMQAAVNESLLPADKVGESVPGGQSVPAPGGHGRNGLECSFTRCPRGSSLWGDVLVVSRNEKPKEQGLCLFAQFPPARSSY